MRIKGKVNDLVELYILDLDVLQEYKIWYKENNEYKDDYIVFGMFYKSIGEKNRR